MKRTRFTEEQIAKALLQAEAGTPVAEICRSLPRPNRVFIGGRRSMAAWVRQRSELRQLREENKKPKAW